MGGDLAVADTMCRGCGRYTDAPAWYGACTCYAPATAAPPAGQSRAGSAAEAVVNTAVGYVVAVAGNLVILPAFGLPASLAQNLGVAACFTALSLVRGYVLRRVFNRHARTSRP